MSLLSWLPHTSPLLSHAVMTSQPISGHRGTRWDNCGPGHNVMTSAHCPGHNRWLLPFQSTLDRSKHDHDHQGRASDITDRCLCSILDGGLISLFLHLETLNWRKLTQIIPTLLFPRPAACRCPISRSAQAQAAPGTSALDPARQASQHRARKFNF